METIEVDINGEGFIRISTFWDDHYNGDIILERGNIQDLILKLRKFQTPIRLESPVE